MLRYLKHHQIDKEQWDACITNAPNGIIYAYSWYLDIVNEGWHALVNDDYSTVMPLTKGRKYLMDYIYPPFFTQQLGVFSKNKITEEECKKFLNAIPSAFRFVEMNLNISNKWIPENFSVKKNINYILDLNKPYNVLRNGYKENHSRNLSKAEKNGLSVFKNASVELVINMFTQNRGRLIPTLEPPHYALFAKLYEEALKRKMASIWSVNNGAGVPCAAAVFFECQNQAIFIFSAVTSEGRDYRAMHFLIDLYIRENCQRLSQLDFEGSNNPDLGRFYSGFGSAEFVYLQIKKNQLPPPWRWFKN